MSISISSNKILAHILHEYFENQSFNHTVHGGCMMSGMNRLLLGNTYIFVQPKKLKNKIVLRKLLLHSNKICENQDIIVTIFRNGSWIQHTIPLDCGNPNIVLSLKINKENKTTSKKVTELFEKITAEINSFL